MHQTPNSTNTIRKRVSLVSLAALSLAALLISPTIGTHPISLVQALTAPESIDSMIFWQLRLPRVLLAFAIGAALALCGMCFQGLFRNPLATPYTLGVSAGAAFGAALAITFGIQFSLAFLEAPLLFAFLGALASITLVYGITLIRRDFTTTTMLLAGVAVNLFFSSLILFLQYTADFLDSFRIVRWLMGGLDTVGYSQVAIIIPITLLGAAILMMYHRELNLFSVSEEFAISRGVNAQASKITLFAVTSIIVGACVSFCGPIGFVGMMAPHICRLIVGTNHQHLAPASLLFGGIFLTLCDTTARIIIAPAELPVGIITALLGGPFFIWLLLSNHRERSLS